MCLLLLHSHTVHTCVSCVILTFAVVAALPTNLCFQYNRNSFQGIYLAFSHI